MKDAAVTGYEIHRAATHVSRSRRAHDGHGAITVERHAFSTTRPRFVKLVIPPRCSEGVHTHDPSDPVEPAFDEFYLILAGSGTMRLGAETVTVHAGDHVYVPRGIAHGIDNDAQEELTVLITFIDASAA